MSFVQAVLPAAFRWLSFPWASRGGNVAGSHASVRGTCRFPPARSRLAAVGWLLVPGLLGLAASGVHAALLINEVLSDPGVDWNGDGTIDFKSDEWVEIINTGSGVESLDGVFLRDGTGDAYHYGFTGQLAPGEVRVVYGADAVAWQEAQGLSTTGLSLNNSGDRVELWRDVADPRVLDALDAVDVPSHGAARDRTLGREPGGGVWILFDALNPYAGSSEPVGTGCAPTPELDNQCSPNVAATVSSWGAVKSRFSAAEH
jgi:hypothetical protein